MGQENIRVDESRAIQVINRAIEAKNNHSFIFKTENEFPEEKFIKMVQELGENDSNYPLNALFLITPLVRGDDTFKFFNRIVNSSLLKKNSWIFEPQRVVDANNLGVNVPEICQQTLRLGGYSVRYLDNWVHNCQVLVNHYQGSVKNFFQVNHHNAEEIIEKLVVTPRAKTKQKPEFRGFGPKIATLTVQWMNQYFGFLENTDSIGVPVDFQISRILIQTRAIDLTSPQNVFQVTQKTISPLIKKICQKEGVDPRDISESLWLIGSRCCNSQRCNLCPINNLCEATISRKNYDQKGKFYPIETRK